MKGVVMCQLPVLCLAQGVDGSAHTPHVRDLRQEGAAETHDYADLFKVFKAVDLL